MVHFRAPPAISGTECPHLRQSGLSTRPCLWHLPPWIQRHVAKWVVSGWPSGWSVVDPLGHFSLSNHCRMCYRICGELRNSNWLPSSVNTIGLSNVPSVDSSYRVLDPVLHEPPTLVHCLFASQLVNLRNGTHFSDFCWRWGPVEAIANIFHRIFLGHTSSLGTHSPLLCMTSISTWIMEMFVSSHFETIIFSVRNL